MNSVKITCNIYMYIAYIIAYITVFPLLSPLPLFSSSGRVSTSFRAPFHQPYTAEIGVQVKYE